MTDRARAAPLVRFAEWLDRKLNKGEKQYPICARCGDRLRPMATILGPIEQDPSWRGFCRQCGREVSYREREGIIDLTHRATIAWAVALAFVLLVHGVVVRAVVHRVPVRIGDGRIGAGIPVKTEIGRVLASEYVFIVNVAPNIKRGYETGRQSLEGCCGERAFARINVNDSLARNNYGLRGDADSSIEIETDRTFLQGREQWIKLLWSARKFPEAGIKRHISRGGISEISNLNLEGNDFPSFDDWRIYCAKSHPGSLVQFERALCFGKLARSGVRRPLLLNGLILHLVQSSRELGLALVNRGLSFGVGILGGNGSVVGGLSGLESRIGGSLRLASLPESGAGIEHDDKYSKRLDGGFSLSDPAKEALGALFLIAAFGVILGWIWFRGFLSADAALPGFGIVVCSFIVAVAALSVLLCFW